MTSNGSGADRPYLSIGEVLGLLLEEFPDITISKIRFLESQGLIEPERTASGYRKFYDADVERLRLILREQRENYLPLRVIRDRLDSGAMDDTSSISVPGGQQAVLAPSVAASNVAGAPRGIRNVQLPAARADADAADGPDDPTGSIPVDADPVQTDRHPAAQSRSANGAANPTPSTARPTASAPSVPALGARTDGSSQRPADKPESVVASPPATSSPSPTAPPERLLSVVSSNRAAPLPSNAGVYLRAEACSMVGITELQLTDLESFGLVSGRGSGSNTTYSDGDLTILRAAAGFLERGIDARHLRSWRQSAEREAGLFEQRILPLLRQRNPQARQQALALLDEFADLGAQLRSAIVQAALRHHLET